ncbi:MAG: hypothetical protein GEV04_17085 [Actinophytocola sp.]|nr:hypothetical protein [Actinophytocola sp.]
MSGARTSRRAWGWHRLTDTWVRQIVDAAGVRPGELVLDITAAPECLPPTTTGGLRRPPHPAEPLTRIDQGPPSVPIRHRGWPLARSQMLIGTSYRPGSPVVTDASPLPELCSARTVQSPAAA